MIPSYFNFDSFIEVNFKSTNNIGFDPYDFANTKYHFSNHKVNTALSYCNKVSPINFRDILKIPRFPNTKSNALLLLALLHYDPFRYKVEIDNLIDWFENNKSIEFSETSWGFASNIDLSEYNSGPGKTSLIISLFVIYAYIKHYELFKDERILKSIMEFDILIRTKWLKQETENSLWYSYLPGKKIEIYNATAKVGRFYTLMYKLTNNNIYKENVTKILSYLLQEQREDYSWPYSDYNKYVDGFHTAFVLEAIIEMNTIVKDARFYEMFNNGAEYYLKNLFTGSEPLHFSSSDKMKNFRKTMIGTEIRDCAMAIIFFSKIDNRKMADEVIDYSFKRLYSEKKQYFFFYKNSLWSSKIPFIRWQSWMIYALSVYKNKFNI